MIYIKWTKEDLVELDIFDGIVVLYTAIDNEGNVQKEIGVNHDNKVIHKSPSSNYRYGKYGIFDTQKVVLSINNEHITKEKFDSLWG